jgi:hypothetical protein
VASLWSGGDKIVITPSGNVGIGTDRPDARFEVIGGDIHMEAGRTFYSHGRMHLHGEELLYLLNKGGVIVSKAWGGSGNLTVEGDIILGASQSLYSGGRLHINGEENLYFLNKGGVIVSKAWGGNGNLTVEGRIEGAMNKLTSGNGRFIMTLTDEGTVTMFDSQGIPGWNNSWVVWAPPQPS